MADRIALKFRMLHGVALVALVLSQMPSGASAETLTYSNRQPPRQSAGARPDPYFNPYQRKRLNARLEASEQQPETQVAETRKPIRSMLAQSQPLRITIPNIEEAAQQRRPFARSGTYVTAAPRPQVQPNPAPIETTQRYAPATPTLVPSFNLGETLTTAGSTLAGMADSVLALFDTPAPAKPEPIALAAAEPEADPAQLAALAPAAGAPTPLIPELPRDFMEAPAQPAPAEKPKEETQVSVPANAAGPVIPDLPPPPPPPAASAAPVPPAGIASGTMALDAELQKPASSVSAAPAPMQHTTAPAPEPAKAETPNPAPAPVVEAPKPEPVKAEAVKPAPAPVAEAPPAPEPVKTPPATEASGEPAPSLSAESEKILKKIAAHPEKKKKGSSEPIDIDRSKDTEEAMGGMTSATTTEQSEAMGIKIEVKQRAVDFDYELEKAYNALIAGQSQIAIEIYKNILANEPKNKSALFGLATTYHRAGQIDMARPLYGKLLGIDPNNRDALNNFLVLLADEAPKEALTQLEKLEAANPGFSPIPAQMAVIYQKLGDTEQASGKMFKAVGLAPENLTYRYNLAIILDKQQKYDEAGKLYKQLIDASRRGETIPGNIQKIQERLTFISSNRP